MLEVICFNDNINSENILLVALASAIFWAIVWFYKGDYIYDQLLKLLTIIIL